MLGQSLRQCEGTHNYARAELLLAVSTEVRAVEADGGVIAESGVDRR